METTTILNMNVVDVREVEGRKRPNMERVGFERGLDSMLQSKMAVKEIVTDGHLSYACIIIVKRYIYILAAIDFNEHRVREVEKTTDGKRRLKILLFFY